jgi:Lysosomal transcription factor, NCU-G1
MQIDIVAKNVSSNFTRPRIAIEFLLVSSEKKEEGSFQMNRRRNLDDEFTPGIFDIYNLISPRSSKDSQGGFIQFRPVCYKSEVRTVSSSTESRHGNIQNVTDEILVYRYTLPFDYFGYSIHSMLTQAINITFGMPDDGFYRNYISFSFLIGLGEPSYELLSPFVITFATIGLSFPLLVLLVGGTYVAIKRYRS